MFGAKPIVKGVKTLGKGALKTIGSPAAGLGFAGWTVADNLAEGKNIADAVVDPLVGVDLLLPEVVKQLGANITSKNVLSKILSLQILDKFPYAAKVGLAAKIVRSMTPIGLGITAAGSLKDAYQDYQRRKPDIEKVKELRRQGLIKEEEFDETMPMFAFSDTTPKFLKMPMLFTSIGFFRSLTFSLLFLFQVLVLKFSFLGSAQ